MKHANRWFVTLALAGLALDAGAVAAADDTVWVSDQQYSELLQYGPRGQRSALYVAPYRPTFMTIGADGNIYCEAGSVTSGSGMLRVTPTGTMTFIPIADAPFGGIVPGRDGTIWFVAGIRKCGCGAFLGFKMKNPPARWQIHCTSRWSPVLLSNASMRSSGLPMPLPATLGSAHL